MFKFLLAATLATIANAHQATVFVIDPLGHEATRGTLTFTETANGLRVQGEIFNLIPGNHGLWIHNIGHISGGCENTGVLYNPQNNAQPAGDLGSITADSTGYSKVDITTKNLSLEGANDIIGRAVFVNCPTAPGGGRTACGVIGIVQ